MDVRETRSDEIHFVIAESGDLKLIRAYIVCTLQKASREAILNFSIATSGLVLLCLLIHDQASKSDL